MVRRMQSLIFAKIKNKDEVCMHFWGANFILILIRSNATHAIYLKYIRSRTVKTWFSITCYNIHLCKNSSLHFQATWFFLKFLSNTIPIQFPYVNSFGWLNLLIIIWYLFGYLRVRWNWPKCSFAKSILVRLSFTLFYCKTHFTRLYHIIIIMNSIYIYRFVI